MSSLGVLGRALLASHTHSIRLGIAFKQQKCQYSALSSLVNDAFNYTDSHLLKNSRKSQENGCVVSSNLEQRRFKRPIYLKRKPPTRTVEFNYSGDLMKQAQIDGNQLHYAYSDVKELESVPGEIKQLFTLDFAHGAAVKEHRMAEMTRHIETLLGKDCALEKQIALATVGIRNEMHHCMAVKKDTRCKARLVERIQWRKKKLKELRQADHERFVWLLSELRIKYVSPPRHHVCKWKRHVQREQVLAEVAAEKKVKVDELRTAFEKERVDFEVYKRRVLVEVEADMAALGLDDSDVVACVQASIVEPEPDTAAMTRLQRAVYEDRKAKKARQWRYVREG